MGLKSKIIAAIAAITLSAGATSAAATTYDFDQAVPDTGPFSLSCDAGGILNYNGCSVVHTPAGYGVNGSPDGFGGQTQIDSFPGWETLTVNFNWAVRLVEFQLGNFNTTRRDRDDYDYRINGGSWTILQTANPNAIDVNNVTSFSIRASTSSFRDFWNDDFTLAKMTVAPVPIPAAGFLLLGGLGGLAALRRRKKS